MESKAFGGVRKVVDVFEDQAVIKPKSSAHLIDPLHKTRIRFLMIFTS